MNRLSRDGNIFHLTTGIENFVRQFKLPVNCKVLRLLVRILSLLLQSKFLFLLCTDYLILVVVFTNQPPHPADMLVLAINTRSIIDLGFFHQAL